MYMGPFSLFMALRGAVGILLGYAEQGKRNRKVDEANRRWMEEKAIAETYPKPYRDPKYGKIIIQNSKLYDEDVRKYGAYQAHKWVMQGKYNLSPEEYQKEIERIKKMYDWN